MRTPDIISPCRNAGMAPPGAPGPHADESQPDGRAVGWRANTKRRPWCEGYMERKELRGEGRGKWKLNR